MQKDILFKGQTPNIKHEGDLCLLEFSSHTREKLIRRVGLSPYLPSFSLSLVNYHPPPLGCCIAGSQAMVTDQGSKEIDWKAVGKWSLGWGGRGGRSCSGKGGAGAQHTEMEQSCGGTALAMFLTQIFASWETEGPREQPGLQTHTVEEREYPKRGQKKGKMDVGRSRAERIWSQPTTRTTSFLPGIVSFSQDARGGRQIPFMHFPC